MSISQPKYEVVIEDLIARIRQGIYAPGSKLPGQFGIAKEYNVSSITANRALQELQKRGYIERRERSGSYVLEKPRFLSRITIITSGLYENEELWLTPYWQGVLMKSERLNISTQVINQKDPLLSTRITPGAGQGVILSGFENQKLIKQLEECNIPYIVIGLKSLYARHNVIANRRLAAKELTEALIRNNCKSPAFLGKVDSPNHNEACQGYKLAIQESSGYQELIYDVDEASILPTLKKVFAGNTLPDSFFIMGSILPFKSFPFLVKNHPSFKLAVMTENSYVNNLQGTAYIAQYSQIEVGKMAFDLLYDLASGKSLNAATYYVPHKIIYP